MKATSYENAMYHWKNGYKAWKPITYNYYKKNFYIGLTFSEFNPHYPETNKAYAIYHDTDHEFKDKSVIYKERGVYNSPEYDYVIKISSQETLDNLTESDYNEILMDFEQKIKYCKVMNRIEDISKDFV